MRMVNGRPWSLGIDFEIASAAAQVPETVRKVLVWSGLKACGGSEGMPKSSDTRIFFNGGSLEVGGGRLLVELSGVGGVG